MPTTMEATEYLQENGVLFAPGKAASFASASIGAALEQSEPRASARGSLSSPALFFRKAAA
jgi:glutamate dehydrogenase/leucine dehydrogenase